MGCTLCTAFFIAQNGYEVMCMYGLYVNHDLFMISDDVDTLFDQVVCLSMDDDATIKRIEEE